MDGWVETRWRLVTVKKSGDLHILFSAEVLVILPSLTLQVDAPRSSRPGPPVVPSLWSKVTPEKVRADRVTGLPPAPGGQVTCVPGRWTDGGGVEWRSESRTAVQLDQGSGLLGRDERSGKERAVSIETPVSVCGRRSGTSHLYLQNNKTCLKIGTFQTYGNFFLFLFFLFLKNRNMLI